MIPFPFRTIHLLLSIYIYSVGAIDCDFCPYPAILNSDDSLCTELLRIARRGNLYHNEEECDFNIPILASRCKCSAPAPPRHKPCDPCAAIAGNSLDIGNDELSTTFTNPGGKLTIFENKKYSCVELLFSARNGGLHSSKCDDLSIPDNTSACGRCIKTDICRIDEALCRPETILVATNRENFPSPSNLWSTALTCQDLIEGARNGSLFSATGCTTLEKSILATFNSEHIGHGLFDLSRCGLQCNYDENAASKDTVSLQLPTGDILAGRLDGANSQVSDVPSDGPSLQPSDGPSLHTSEMPIQKYIQSQEPSDLPSMMGLVRSQTNHPLNRFPETGQDTSQEDGLEEVSLNRNRKMYW